MNTHMSSGIRALRRGRDSAVGRHYLLTTVCRRRERRFASAPCARAVSAVLEERRLWRDSCVLCWVLMPDHLHAVVALGREEGLAKLVQRVKAVTAAVANAVDGRSGPVWMAGYHDRALRSDEHLLTVARYVVANPLRAGLVSRVIEYPYWGAVWQKDGHAEDAVG